MSSSSAPGEYPIQVGLSLYLIETLRIRKNATYERRETSSITLIS